MPPAALPGAKLLPDLIKSGFDKQVFMSEPDKFMFVRNLLSRWHTLPPEAFFGAE